MGTLLCPSCRGRLTRQLTPEESGARLTMHCEACGYASLDAVVERRRDPRRAKTLKVTVVHGGRRAVGECRNVSAAGMAIGLPSEPPQCGSSVRLEVTVGDDQVELVGTVVWAQSEGDRAAGEMGIAFDPLRVAPKAVHALMSAGDGGSA